MTEEPVIGVEAPLDLEEIYPAPNIPEVVPLTLGNLRAFLDEHTEHFDGTFALANMLLNLKRFDSAASLYKELLSVHPDQAGVCCNLGIAYLHLRRLSDAETFLKRALEHAPHLTQAQYHLAKTALAQDSLHTAKTRLEQLIRIQSGHFSARIMLGDVLIAQGNHAQALTHFRFVYGENPQHEAAQVRLGEYEFKRGKTLYADGQLHDALELWKKAYTDYPAAFSASAFLLRELEKTRSAHRDEVSLDVYSRRLCDSFFALPLEEQDYYELFTDFLFVHALLPQVYVPRSELKTDLEYWKQQIEEHEQYPYALFRISLSHCYTGELEKAFDELAKVRDSIPETKRRSLRITECISFVQKLRSALRHVQSGHAIPATADEWEAAGILGEVQRHAWERLGIHPSIAGQWKQDGFSAEEAAPWIKKDIDPSDAALWLQAGCKTPQDAVRWMKGGFQPSEAQQWSETLDAPVETIVQCKAVGFDDPEEAAAWLRVFMFPSEAKQWRDVGLTPAEAVFARGDGIRDPFIAAQAKAEKDRSETPDEE